MKIFQPVIISSVKRFCLFFFFLCLYNFANAQGLNIQKVAGSPCVGNPVTFALVGPGTINYWYVMGSNYTIVSGGGTSNSITVKWNSPQSNVGVTANGPSANGTARVNIGNAITPTVSITSSSTNVCKGKSVTFTASGSGGGTSPSYLWYLNGNNVQNGSSNKFTSATLPAGNNQVYVKMYSNATGCISTTVATSNTRAVNVNNPQPMMVTITGTSSICEESGATFSANVTNYSGTLNYQWKKNGINISSDVSGPPPYALVLNSINDGDVITCRVSASTGCYSPATSNAITVDAIPKQNYYTGFSTNGISFCKGDMVTFTAAPGSHPAISYRWDVNGHNSGETGQVFAFAANTVEELKSVKLTTTTSPNSCVKNTTATALAADIPFTISSRPTLPTVQQPYIIEYGTATNLVAGGATTGETYRWYTASTGGTPLASTTTPPLTVDKTYYVSKYNNQTRCETSSRREFRITVNKLPVVNGGPDKTLVLPVNEVTLNGSATDADGTIASYLWTKKSGPDGSLIDSPSKASTKISGLRAGTYVFSLKATDSFNFSHSDDVTVTVSYPPNNYNFIETTTVLAPGISTTIQLSSLPVTKKNISTTYFDGLGRPMQEVSWQGSPEKFDIIRPIVYDQLGRQAINYLPFTSSEKNGWYKPNADLIDSETGLYKGEAANFYAPGSNNQIADDERPFSETAFEPSPLNRVIKQGAPGTAWQPDANNSYGSEDHTVKFSYETNLVNEVLLWNYQYPTTDLPLGLVHSGTSSPNYYAANQLIKTKTKDEEHHEIIEFKDKLGRVILKQVEAPDSEWAETYYIYDDFGNLVTVLPPEAVKGINKTTGSEYFGKSNKEKDAFLQKWAFRYTYDARKRIAIKKVPGADPVYMVYDNRDRLVLTQDGNQRLTNQWTFTKYDVLNRPILTGTYEHGASDQASMQKALNAFYLNAPIDKFYEEKGSIVHGYTNRSYPPVSNASLYLSATYYDNYAFRDELTDFGNSYKFNPNQLSDKVVNGVTYSFPDEENLRVKGQVTGSKVRILEGEEDQWIKTINYYDDKYRPIQSITENHFGKKDIFSSLYDFPGKVLSTLFVHNSNTETNLKTYKDFTYDHAGRLMETYQQIGDLAADKVLLSENEYNELGELVKKHLHKQSDGAFAQSVDYRYNIRGWLQRINNSDLSPDDGDEKDDLFGMELFYNYGFDKPQFNGNISGTRWANKVDEVERAYGYTYDAMNRLTGADYIAGGTGNWTEEADFFEVGNLKYDLNGNILNLHRNGLFRHTLGETPEYGITDQLAYKYEGNQLMAVNDAIDTPEETENDFKDNGSKGSLDNPEYDYDENGNMIWDGNKKINIDYNYLNLPKRVKFDDGKYITYTYDAAGTKLYQTVVDGNSPEKRTDYIAGMVYENDALQFMQHEEGRVIPGAVPGSPYEYQYHLKDHLGNVRLTFTTSPEIETDEATIEPENAEKENAAFINYDKVTRINSTLFDKTGETDSRYSVRLSGAEGEKIGLARSMAVMTGDTIRAKVYGKYLDPEQTNYNQIVQGIVATLASNAVAPGAGIEGSSASEGSNFPFDGLLSKAAVDDQQPQAYLNYLVFDKNMVLIDKKSGYEALTTAAKEDGTNRPHEELATEIIVTEPGFVYIYLSNDSPVPKEIYFDQFNVEHAHSAIVQSDDYYPFGLTFNSYQREGSLKNKYLYNGIETETDLDLGILHGKFRSLDPTTGRWWQVDPKADFLYPFSPYMGMHNNPIRFNDPDGDIAPAIWAAIVYALETGAETGVDIALGVTLSYLTGIPYSGLDVAVDYATNLVPGWGEARTFKKGGEIAVALEKSHSKFSKIGGGANKIYDQVKNGLDEFRRSGDIGSLDKIRGALYEFKLINSLDDVVGAGSNARQISQFAGLGKEAGNQLNKGFGDVTFDVVQKTKDGALNLIEAKTGNVFGRANSFAGLGGKVGQITKKIDFARDLNKAGGNASVEFRFSQKITQGLLNDITNYALKNGVNVKIVFD